MGRLYVGWARRGAKLRLSLNDGLAEMDLPLGYAKKSTRRLNTMRVRYLCGGSSFPSRRTGHRLDLSAGGERRSLLVHRKQ